jgi:hypothetical protein
MSPTCINLYDISTHTWPSSCQVRHPFLLFERRTKLLMESSTLYLHPRILEGQTSANLEREDNLRAGTLVHSLDEGFPAAWAMTPFGNGYARCGGSNQVDPIAPIPCKWDMFCCTWISKLLSNQVNVSKCTPCSKHRKYTCHAEALVQYVASDYKVL